MDKVRRKELIGYVIVGIVIIVLGYVVYKILGESEPDRRYKNIEKLRSDLLVPAEVMQLSVATSRHLYLRA